MATPNLGFDNKFSTTLSSGIVASDTTIPLTALPVASEGYLVIEPDSSTNWEEIYYTSKTGSAVVCPSAAAGRGVGGSTAASHSQGATVRSDTTAEMFESLQDATGLTGLHRYGTDGIWFDFIASGGVITADSAGSTLNYSITSGVVYINGRRHTFNAVSGALVGANKDRYIDLLYSTIDNVATIVTNEVANNAASQALASNSLRLGIVVGGATSIASAASINQGQEDRVLPISSSVPYAVTDSLGNLICPRDPNRKLLCQRRAVANQNTLTTETALTAMQIVIKTDGLRKVKLSANADFDCSATTNYPSMAIKESATYIKSRQGLESAGGLRQIIIDIVLTPTAGTHTYTLVAQTNGGGNVSLIAGSPSATQTGPAEFKAEIE